MFYALHVDIHVVFASLWHNKRYYLELQILTINLAINRLKLFND